MANVCGCTPLTCAEVGATCGTISNGCGGTLDCATSCGTDAECGTTQFCLQGKCEPRLADNRACSTHSECLSDCCCGGTTNDDCGNCAGLKALFCAEPANCDGTHVRCQCPGVIPCGEDSECCGNQFCTGGFCYQKQLNGTQCEFSAACTAGCCCPMGSTSICTDKIFCSSGCQCVNDSQCTSTQFCTGGFCAPKQDNGTACQFSSACTSGCCCSTDGQCADASTCGDAGGTCNP